MRPSARCASAPERPIIEVANEHEEDTMIETTRPGATRHEVKGGGGLRLHVREWGRPDGQPIVLIHGWSQNHLCWAHQYDSALADEFRLVAFDLRGHGMSDAPLDAAQYTDAALWADDLAAVIE